MSYITCKDCKKPAKVVPFSRGTGFYTKSLKDGCQCGTDQRRGKARQDWLTDNMVDDLESIKPLPEPKPGKSESKPKKSEQKSKKVNQGNHSKLWWLAIPLLGIGYVFSRAVGGKKS